MDLWRISKYQTLDGRGGIDYAGRWHNAGNPIVYLAASPPGALIEILVHLELHASTMPHLYTLLQVDVPAGLAAPLLHPASAEAWTVSETITRRIGDKWLASRKSALSMVPSAVMPRTFNYLLNPLHPDAARLRLAEVIPAELDRRLAS